ncbi:TPA: hypothetical protein DCL30_03695 [Candidatus Peribacteria bacterium]|nr:MAG: hypothetical protein A3J91_00620 [Candidatus Peribacteria bacterium RIFOXYC2_FULL_58_10]OGJ84844.1 MAG: hypothetical protein A2529_00815 [Candidatus Peribacteria bacterium RIFOXYD2_FULL_58_15]HAI98609.1 hypothetical protein [Candidatus Peribacteria bacterium]HAS34322.1 hypothetical protein [Candidatus Peribacteria bacterium]
MILSRFSRASLALFLAGAACGIGATAVATSLGSAVFDDVRTGSFYDAAVGEMYAAGIIRGYQDGRFGPDDYVTRGQLAVMLQRLKADLTGNVSSSSSSSRSSSSSSSSSSSVATTQNPAGTIRFTAETYTGKENGATASVTVIRAGGVTGAVTVDYATSDGTAKANTDYEPSSGTLHFSDKQSTAAFPVKLLNNTLTDGTRTITLTVSNAKGGAVLGTPVTATLNITDDESPASSSNSSTSSTSSTSGSTGGGTFSFGASAYEIVEDAGRINVTVVRTNSTSGQATVQYSLTNGTALATQHYNASGSSITFLNGESSKTFPVLITDNESINGNKTFTVTLTSTNASASLGDLKSAVVTIADDEIMAAGSGSLKFGKSTFLTGSSSSDTKIPVTVQRVGGTKGTVKVSFATYDVTAVAGLDYTSAQGTLTFVDGESLKTISIPSIESSRNKSGTKFGVRLTSLEGSTITSPTETTVEFE